MKIALMFSLLFPVTSSLATEIPDQKKMDLNQFEKIDMKMFSTVNAAASRMKSRVTVKSPICRSQGSEYRQGEPGFEACMGQLQQERRDGQKPSEYNIEYQQ